MFIKKFFLLYFNKKKYLYSSYNFKKFACCLFKKFTKTTKHNYKKVLKLIKTSL